MYTEQVKEVIEDVERAANAAFFSMDYPLLRIIIDTQKSTKLAYEQLDGVEMMYLSNRAFWDIGCYLKTKLTRYPQIFLNPLARIFAIDWVRLLLLRFLLIIYNYA